MTTQPEPAAGVVLRKDLQPAVEVPQLSRARRAVLAVARPLPNRQQLAASARWWAVHLLRVAPWLPLLVLRELRPIGRGLGDLLHRWSTWVSAQDRHEYAKAAEGNLKAKQGLAASKTQTARRWLSLAAVLVALTAGVWAWLRQPLTLAAAAILVAAALDWHGRRLLPGADPLPAAVQVPRVLDDGVPLSQITASILETLEREGFEPGSVGVAEPLVYDHDRHEYRISLATRDEIKPEHLRAIERAVGARDYAVRNLATDTATVRQLVIRVGDPLATPVERPWIPTGSRSIVEGITLGVSATEVPFTIPFAGVHIRIVAGTGGGKTSWLLRSIIDGLSACHDVVIGGIDITNGPELTLWRDVIQYKGFDPASADKVLDKALAEIDRRSKILSAIAEDDDPDNDAAEWHSGLGPAFVVLVDEFSQLAAFDGRTGPTNPNGLNLLAKCEQIVRTGRKHWVSLVMLTQKTGNSDFGSTTMQTQCAVTIAGPCDQQDANRIFGADRREAGYTPHLLRPGVEGDARDAGKVFVESPWHRTPDIYRAYAPGTTAEVKRRARQRIEDGLPRLDSTLPAEVLDAVEVPPVLAAVEAAFRDAGCPERMATAELLDRLADAGLTLTSGKLADEVRPAGLQPTRWHKAGSSPVRGYRWVDVERAIREIT